MYMDVTDKGKHCERQNLIHKFLCPDDQHHSENLVNTGKQETASANVHAHIMYRKLANRNSLMLHTSMRTKIAYVINDEVISTCLTRTRVS